MMNGNNRDDHNSHYPSSLSASPPCMNDFGNSWQQNNSPPNNPGSQTGSPALNQSSK